MSTADQTADDLLTLASTLNASEGFYIEGIVLARTKAGKLRCGFGCVVFSWFRGEAETLLHEHLQSLWLKRDYQSSGRRRRIVEFLETPRAYRAHDVGRLTFRLERGTDRKMKFASDQTLAVNVCPGCGAGDCTPDICPAYAEWTS